jgi:integrase
MKATAREKFRKGKSEGWYVFTYSGNTQKSRRVRDEATAKAIAAEINARGEASGRWLVGGPLPLDEAMRGWINVHGHEMAPSTEETHRGSIESHLIPYFGSQDLRAITRDDLLLFAADRFGAGKSAATIRNALSALRRVYSLHVEAGLLERNPCEGCGALVGKVARRYERGVREVDAWTRAEASTLLNIASEREIHVYPVLLAALCTGMRRGELLALRWEHVSGDEIRVRDSLVRGAIKTPKSGRARSVPISPEMQNLLRELRRTRMNREGAWSDPEHVFTTATGHRWDEKNFSRAWRRLRRHCVDSADPSIRPLSFHCCRHTFASWALESGKSIVWVQHVLGHASPDTTLRCYSHFIPREREEMGFLRLAAGTPPDVNPAEPDVAAIVEIRK